MCSLVILICPYSVRRQTKNNLRSFSFKHTYVYCAMKFKIFFKYPLFCTHDPPFCEKEQKFFITLEHDGLNKGIQIPDRRRTILIKILIIVIKSIIKHAREFIK